MNIIATNYSNNRIVGMQGTRLSKKRSQQIHFVSACLERVGEVLDSKKIVKLIQSKQLEFIDKQSNTLTRWKYTHNNNDYIVVYHNINKQIVTIIPYKEGTINNVMDNCDLYWWLRKK